MHTRMAPYELYLWLAIIFLQFGVGVASRQYMRVYLLAESLLGGALLAIAQITPWQVYFKAYCASIFAHEGLVLFVSLCVMNEIRRCGLPTRRSFVPIQLGLAIAFVLGIWSSSAALVQLQSPNWRLIFSWDHAFQFAVCLMIGVLPVYAVYISASLSRPLLLKIIGLGAYSAVNAGVLDNFIICRTVSHAADFAYVGSLLIWFLAGRADCKANPASTPALELEDFPQCEG